MKNYKKVIAIIVSMAVLTGTGSSCALSGYEESDNDADNFEFED